MWTEWANFYDQKHLLNNHQQLFFLSFFFCFACKEKEGWCSFFAPTSSTLICYNAELHSRLTIWSTGRIHSGPLACELVARYQYRWSSSLSFLPLPISGKEKIEVKALQRFFFQTPFCCCCCCCSGGGCCFASQKAVLHKQKDIKLDQKIAKTLMSRHVFFKVPHACCCCCFCGATGWILLSRSLHGACVFCTAVCMLD